MAKLYVKEEEVPSRIAWLYVIMTKSKVDVVKIDAKNSEHSTINTLKIFPYFIDGDVQIWGDHAIISYIADKYGNNLYFGLDPIEKGRINSIFFWISGSLSRCALYNYVYPQHKEAHLYKLDLDSDNILLVDSGQKSTSDQLHNIEACYFKTEDSKFLAGKESIVDYYLAMILLELEKYNFKLDAWPKTSAWLNTLKPQMNVLQARMV